jgi:hypothetical protein
MTAEKEGTGRLCRRLILPGCSNFQQVKPDIYALYSNSSSDPKYVKDLKYFDEFTAINNQKGNSNIRLISMQEQYQCDGEGE